MLKMKKIGIHVFIWICLLSAIINNGGCIRGFKILKEIECNQIAECLPFNYIPHDIPDNVTTVILHNVQNVENIKKGTFDGKNWDKVKILKISTTPDSRTGSGQDQESQNSYSKSEIYLQSGAKSMNDKQRITTMVPLQSDHKFSGLYEHTQLIENYIKSIEPYAMENLSSLEELYIESNFFEGLDYGCFAGLDRLEVLSFKKCGRLSLENIIKAINGSETVSNLQTLSMTYINVVPWKWNGVVLGKDFFTAISTKPLQLLDIHKILLKTADVKYLSGTVVNTLKYINLSSTSLNEINYGAFTTFKQPRLLDISSMTLPMYSFIFLKFLPLSNSVFPLNLSSTTILKNFESLEFSNIYHEKKPIEVYNVTVKLINAKHDKWSAKNLILRQNKLKFLDVTIHAIEPCINASFELIDLSYNEMTFLRPNFCPCCFNLEIFNLSYNKLHTMSELNYSVFSQIFNFYPSLKEVYLISNGLSRIPEDIFKGNSKLEIIDFSHNKLEQARCRLLRLKNLKLLNLQYNKITMFDITSLNNLKSFKLNLSGVFDFRYNPIACSKCETLQSIKWLATSRFIVHTDQDFVCFNDKGIVVPVDRSSVMSVQELCDRPKRIRNIILIGTLAPFTLIILIIATACIIRKYRRHKQYALGMAEKLRLIREGAMVTKFVVFLCCSGIDDDFVRNYVYPPLNQFLKNTVETDKDLVALGDKEFHPGKDLNDEMVRCLEESSVVIIVLSQSFCESGYCRAEFDHALRMDKPIILMLKEEVDEDKMAPSLRLIFKKNVRILWENQEDGYQLKTSWKNVCTSILELVQY